MTVRIQDDYWNGTKCVEYEVPWQTPDSIYYLDTLCSPTDKVLEIGTGGSTLFYARRCSLITAIETNKNWYEKMKKILKERNITNVNYLLIENQKQIEDKLNELSGFSIASVDSDDGYNRSSFLNIILKNVKQLEVLVLDNYGDTVVFSEHFNKKISDLASMCPGNNWIGKDFDDIHWRGRGTRILTVRNNR